MVSEYPFIFDEKMLYLFSLTDYTAKLKMMMPFVQYEQFMKFKNELSNYGDKND